MDWKPLPPLEPMTDEWSALARAYSRMSLPQLLEEATRISAAMQSQSRATVSASLTSRISELDQPVLRSTPTVVRSPDRGPASTPSHPSRTSALDLLLLSGRAGPRLAAKMVKVGAAAQRRREVRIG